MPQIINKIIRVMIISDIAFHSGWGLLGPVFAIFIVQNIEVGSVAEAAKVAGFATLVYWVVKSFLQIPIGRYLDKNHGEKDDLWFMVIGTFLTGLVPLGFIISTQPMHVYFFQVLQAIGMAMVVPSWSAVFTRHIDLGREAFEWSLRSTSLGFATGLTGAVGGVMAAIFGFKAIFILAGLLSIVSALLLLLIHKEVAPHDKILPHIPRFKIPF